MCLYGGKPHVKLVSLDGLGVFIWWKTPCKIGVFGWSWCVYTMEIKQHVYITGVFGWFWCIYMVENPMVFHGLGVFLWRKTHVYKSDVV